MSPLCKNLEEDAMTIQEAIKSGKPFRRLNSFRERWLIVVGNNPFFEYEPMPKHKYGRKTDLSPDDILATDWEVKE